MNGIIDELAIYHRALSQQEIQADMKAPISEQLSVQPALKLTTTWANIKIWYESMSEMDFWVKFIVW